jgi:hypothetical protein
MDDVAGSPADIDLHVAAVRPPQLCQPLKERSDAGLSFGVLRGQRHEHADAPHALGLLRPRRQRPCNRRAAERDELPPS